MLKRGAFTVCVSWSLRMLKEQKLNRSYLSQLYDVFDIIAKNSRAIPKNYNFVTIYLILEQPNFQNFYLIYSNWSKRWINLKEFESDIKTFA